MGKRATALDLKNPSGFIANAIGFGFLLVAFTVMFCAFYGAAKLLAY